MVLKSSIQGHSDDLKNLVSEMQKLCQNPSKTGLSNLFDLISDLNEKDMERKVNGYQNKFVEEPNNINALRLIALQ